MSVIQTYHVGANHYQAEGAKGKSYTISKCGRVDTRKTNSPRVKAVLNSENINKNDIEVKCSECDY